MRGGRLLGIDGGSFSIRCKCYRKALGRASSIPCPVPEAEAAAVDTPERSRTEVLFTNQYSPGKRWLAENFFELNSPHTVSW
jgi:hypothetical protein